MKLGIAFPLALLCTASMVAATLHQTGNIADLGRPTTALPLYQSLGGFHHVKVNFPRHRGKPELLFLGTQVDEYSAAERWPVVKSLNQFGTWSGLKSSSARYCVPTGPLEVDCSTTPYTSWHDYPTFDWEHARYTSRFVAFAHKELIDRDLRVRQQPSPAEMKLFNRYVRLPGYPEYREAVLQSTVKRALSPERSFPLVLIGGYLQVGVNVAVQGDMTDPRTNTNLDFETIHESLRTGTATGGAPDSLIQDYNAESNIITALICHADGMRPSSVCSRPAIRAILKNVK